MIINVAEWHINKYIAKRHVTVYQFLITPLTKQLLCKRNKLMHRGLYTKADEITVTIGQLINEKRYSLLSKFNNRSTKQL